jgi:hypothetical protein
MTKFRVTRKDAGAWSSVEGTFPVANGIIDLPASSKLAFELLAAGEILPMPPGQPAAPVEETKPEAPYNKSTMPVPPPIEDNDEQPEKPKRAARKAK